jgi:hypothetical protein
MGAGTQHVAYEVFGDGPRDLAVAPGYMSNLQQNWTWPPYARFLERLGPLLSQIVDHVAGRVEVLVL